MAEIGLTFGMTKVGYGYTKQVPLAVGCLASQRCKFRSAQDLMIVSDSIWPTKVNRSGGNHDSTYLISAALCLVDQ